MFGYIACNKETLEQQEKERYQSLYCGLCRNLGQRHGALQKVLLSYDMTFLALFLSALYEPEDEMSDFICGLHPMHKKTGISNEYVEYAADMTIALAYHKCMDDYADEHSVFAKKYGELLRKHYEKICLRYPRQCKAIERSVEELKRIEKNGKSTPDDAVNCSGRMLEELFVYKEDFWSNSLRIFGYELGRFIYLMDATMDYDKDRKKQNYNPLIKMQKRPEDMESILMQAIGRATEQFEKLPIVEDAVIIRKILYGGVWQQFYAKMHRKEKQ